MSTETVQNAVYVAINLQDILYGIQLVLYFETVHAVLALKKKQRSDIVLLLFSTVMMILVTIWIAATGILGEETWVIHGSKSPADANAYWFSALTGWYMNLARTAIFVLQLMTDALLIHRCRAIWNNTVVIIVPLLLWIASLVLAVIQSWMIALYDSGHVVPGVALYVSLSYYIVCVVLNTTLTSLICYRLIRHGKRTRAELGRKFASVYFAVVEIIVESALPFTLAGIASLITLGLNLDIMTPFGWVYYLMTCISPQMLILRVLRNKNLPRNIGESATTMPSLRFNQWSVASMPEGAADGPKGTACLLPLTRAQSVSTGDKASANKEGVSL